MSAIDDLLHYIFNGEKPALYIELETWIRESRRYKEFATHYRSKIRAKLKNARDEDGEKDVRAELETAALLLREKSFTLEYEHYAAAKQRGPDFTLTFKTHTPFNVEVRRIRPLELDDDDTEAYIHKLIAVVYDKVGQMPPSIVNLLWLIAEHDISEADLIEAVMTLRQLAEDKTEEYFTRRGFKSAGDFLKQYRRLSCIILRQSGENIVWLNPITRHQPLSQIISALQRI